MFEQAKLWSNLALLAAALFLVSCNFSGSGGDVIEIRGETMGSYYVVKYIAEKDSLPSEGAAEAISGVLVWINEQFNHYDPESTLSKFNKKKDLDWYQVDEKFLFVLRLNKDMSEASEGSFDPAILALTRAWGFAGDYRGKSEKRVLADSEVKELLKNVGLDKIEIDTENKRIRKKVPGVELDFSASVPGLAADDLSWCLENVVKTKNFMVDIGGEMHIKGTNNGNPWKIAIEAPHEGSDRVVQKILKLSDINLATSGNYRNYIESDGKKLSHILDAKTGKPAPSDILSVTVLDKYGAFNADLWSTTLMTLGIRRAYFLAEQRGIPAYFIYEIQGADGVGHVKVRETSRMKEYLEGSILESLQEAVK